MFLRKVSEFLQGFGLINVTVQAVAKAYFPILSGEELVVPVNLSKQVEIESVNFGSEELCRVGA